LGIYLDKVEVDLLVLHNHLDLLVDHSHFLVDHIRYLLDCILVELIQNHLELYQLELLDLVGYDNQLLQRKILHLKVGLNLLEGFWNLKTKGKIKREGISRRLSGEGDV